MILLRNISHIIKYEKSKNQTKYQELLTATMSHEMLTPLNSIINLSIFLEAKFRKNFYQEMQLQGGVGSSAD